MKISKIDVNNTNYSDYTKWLSEVSYAKRQLNEKDQERKEINREILALSNQLSKKRSEVRKIEDKISQIREELIDCLPSNF